MKFVLFVGILFVSKLSLVGQPQPVKVTDDLSLAPGVARYDGIDDIYRKFSKAYRDLDPKAVGDLYSKDAAYLVPGDDVVVGNEPILKSFASFFDTMRARKETMAISFHIVQRKVQGSIGYDVGIFTLRFYKDGKELRSGQGKFVVVALKEGEVWRFQVDGYSDIAKPKPAQ